MPTLMTTNSSPFSLAGILGTLLSWLMPSPLGTPDASTGPPSGGVPMTPEGDWGAAQARLAQGRVLDPSQDALSAVPTWTQQWAQGLQHHAQGLPGIGPFFAPPVRSQAPTEGVEAVPFGALEDPVSQLAFLAAPTLQRAVVDMATRPPFSPFSQAGAAQGHPVRGQFLQGERGSTGHPTTSLDALKQEFLARGGVESGEGVRIRGDAPTVAKSVDELRKDVQGVLAARGGTPDAMDTILQGLGARFLQRELDPIPQAVLSYKIGLGQLPGVQTVEQAVERGFVTQAAPETFQWTRNGLAEYIVQRFTRR